MIIALSYGTYRNDPELWAACVQLMHLRGHEVHVVTMGKDVVPISLPANINGAHVHCTGGQNMRGFLHDKGIQARTWIAERPDFIVGQPPPRDLAEQSNWGGM